ncbi:yippee-domain-containing protein [Aaosphaeria arxii CBS 175.79]|uniref:Yippee-domain-containing protein n=1 Tax=Aaosphaeria arxii CBS 175.79 TaxID=1450172 RepID=A0A6A5XGB3_9PLEO|nr:yippee-domain-containing protein [Aaosphaeria arxii CBS 175.79]KAF2011896.1 yippee-domain-containing protein [Aaosphaeria arxii CBS 175.79]
MPFPLYLLPSIPFRRRRSSATTTSTSSQPNSPSSSPSQPSFLGSNLPTSHLRCQKCLADLIPTSSIISKGFTGRHGRAYLVAPPPPSAIYPYNTVTIADEVMRVGDLPNVNTHSSVPRQLVTGAHTVSDISCKSCGTVIGWKYVDAEEDSQKYKVGKFILETRRIVKSVDWEDGAVDEAADGTVATSKNDEEIEFDSQDEDECEDLFAGIWTPALARRRRKNRAFRDDE